MSDEYTSAVLGTTTTIKTLVDGTFRVSIDISPRDAQQAFALFGAPGTQVALARVMPEVALREDRKAMADDQKPRGGALCKLAGMFCNNAQFLEWLRIRYDPLPQTAEDAATIIRNLCKVESRAELDHDDAAASVFHREFRLPYNAWLDGRNR